MHRGSSADYASDDPWLDRESDKFMIYFDGVDDFLDIQPQSGEPNPRFHHSFTVTTMIYPKNVGAA